MPSHCATKTEGRPLRATLCFILLLVCILAVFLYQHFEKR